MHWRVPGFQFPSRFVSQPTNQRLKGSAFGEGIDLNDAEQALGIDAINPLHTAFGFNSKGVAFGPYPLAHYLSRRRKSLPYLSD
ncbi:MAG: hypothetical protein Q8K74_06310 [Candidatus Nitrotoga sp.]|nr:hypothetical protein [Candidatus Nitrotoga sp.]MDP1855649.1 hypothetical protein [Candidatus Nitrotoga sp.]